MAETAIGAAWAVAVAGAALAWGGPLARRWLGETPQAAAFGALFGLVGLSRVTTVLAACGLLTERLLVGLVALLLLLRPRGTWREARLLVTPFRGCGRPTWAVVVVFLVLVLYPVLLAPVVFWDTRVYHLGLPDFWLATGASFLDPRFQFSFYPALAEGFFAYALVAPAGRDAAAVLLSLAPLALASVLLAERLPKGRGDVAALVVLGTPALLVPALVAKNTPLFAFACLASCIPLLEKSTGPRRAAAAGFALGAAFASHYLTIPFAVFPLVLAFRAGRRVGTCFVAAAALVAAPDYLRNFVATGNPVYPYFSRLSLSITPQLPVWEPLRSGAWEPLGIGSTFGLILPVGLAGFFARRRPGAVAAASAVALWLAVTVRFARPRYAAGLTLLGASFAARFWASLPKRLDALTAALAVVGVLESFYLAAWILQAPGPIAVAAERMTRGEYLEAWVPERRLAEWARRNLPPKPSVATLGIVRTYGWGGRLEPVMAQAQPRIADAVRSAAGSETRALAVLRAQGFAHLAVHFKEWRRLARQYGYADLDGTELETLKRLLRRCEVTTTSGGERPVAVLFALPPDDIITP